MSLKKKNPKASIAKAFGKKSSQYEAYAGLQMHVAKRLASYLPVLPSSTAKVLEIGCGTGLLTEHLLQHYPDGQFYITDLSDKMIETCQTKIGATPNLEYVCCDGEYIAAHPLFSNQSFDLIATSMTLQWFQNPLAGLKNLQGLLSPNGHIFYATLGPDNFPEWSKALAECNFPSGTLEMPTLPGLLTEDRIVIDYEYAKNFLFTLKALGAHMPRPGYKNLSYSQLRKVMRRLEDLSSGHITWHIAYGHIEYCHHET